MINKMKYYSLLTFKWKIRQLKKDIKNFKLLKTIKLIIFRFFQCDYRDKDCPFICDGCGNNGRDESY